MKRFLSLLLVLAFIISITGCAKAPVDTSPSTETTTLPADTTAATEPPVAGPSAEAKAALDGKRVLFIGNSYTFWGLAVLSNPAGSLSQADRRHDEGLFYHLCKANGMEVEVTDWVFGGHNVTDIMSHSCMYESGDCMGVDHMSYLETPYFDYVAIQPFFETEYTGDLVSHLQPTVDFFRAANPNVKFILMVPHMSYESNFVWLDSVDALAESGFLICDWGGMVQDIILKKTEVPGATEQYYRCSFVVSKFENDGYHQNILAGYLTALMVYCAITGDSAVGQPYDFCDNTMANSRFGLENYRTNNYIIEPYTNFVEIFRSKADMLGLQTLADQYLAMYNGGN